MLKKNKKTKKKLSHEEGDCFLRQLGSLGACDFRLEVMRGSELASILLMTSLLVMARLIFLDRCSMENLTTLLDAS